GLVGCHGHGETAPGQQGNSLEATLQGLPFGRRLDELVGLLVDDTVPVEHHQPKGPCRTAHQGRLRQPMDRREMSPMSRNKRPRTASCASRFCGSASSSVITITRTKKSSTGCRTFASLVSTASYEPLSSIGSTDAYAEA